MKIKNGGWLPDMDLNHDKQIQSLLCYRYTIGQTNATKLEPLHVESRILRLDKWIGGLMDEWSAALLFLGKLLPARFRLSPINPRIHLSINPSI